MQSFASRSPEGPRQRLSSEPTVPLTRQPPDRVDRPAPAPAAEPGAGSLAPDRSPATGADLAPPGPPEQEGRSVVRATRAKPPLARERALLEAAERGNVANLKALLSAVTSSGVHDADGLTPLMLAAIHGHRDAVRVLIDHGARVNDQSARGLSPLMLAIMNRRLDVVRLLCDRAADVNARDHLGWTPLMHAAWTGDPQVVRLLLQRGADPRGADQRGWTAERHARWRLTHPVTGVDPPGASREVSAKPGGGPIPSRAPHAEVIRLLGAPSHETANLSGMAMQSFGQRQIGER
jgi:hypothetical protein